MATTKFENIHPEDEIKKLCDLYNQLAAHLNYPTSGKVKATEAYSFRINGKDGLKMGLFIRNARALGILEIFINQLDDYFIGVEYFQGKIEFDRIIGKKFPQRYKDNFFVAVISNSLRSSLDIFAKFLACYFDLDEKDEIGFQYKKLIKPMLEIEPPIGKMMNKIYNSNEYNFIKEIRDNKLHRGENSNTVDLVQKDEHFKFSFKRFEPVNLMDFEKQSISLFNKIYQLLNLTIKECQRGKLGYSSNNDAIGINNEHGHLTLMR